jgi:hypothetical protein
MFYKQFLEKANCDATPMGLPSQGSSKVLVQNREIAAAATVHPIKDGGEPCFCIL